MTTLEDVTKKRTEPQSAEAAAAELVKRFTKTILDPALNEEMTEHLGI